MSARRTSLANLPSEIQGDIISHLDDKEDLMSLRSTCRTLNNQVSDSIFGPARPAAPPKTTANTTAPAAPLHIHFNLNPFSSSLSTTNSEHAPQIHSAATSDTEATTPSSDDDSQTPYNFELTADLTRRLSLLPVHKTAASLPHLPTELQLQIFSHLDKIDSCCLGLTHSQTYLIYRSIYGLKLPLNTRRSGPNNLERAWEVVGSQECRHCGVYRCELWKHIESWIQQTDRGHNGMEYCSMAMKFGPAGEGHRDNCYRVKPSKPRRCGKHPVRTTTVHQDDATASAATVVAFASEQAAATLPGAH